MVRPGPTAARGALTVVTVVTVATAAGLLASCGPAAPAPVVTRTTPPTAVRGAPPPPSAPAALPAVAPPVEAPVPGPAPIRLPPANGTFDYQLGGAYPPTDDVQVVSRDRTAEPVGGVYSICYVNLLQTQPDEEGWSAGDPPYGTTAWWEQHHPDLLLRDADGQVVMDDAWGEALLDVRTAAQREALFAIQRDWIAGCRTAGFDAVEPDNLDTHTRSGGLLTFAQTRAYLELVVPFAHAQGLAVAQKNAAGENGYGRTGDRFVGTDPPQGFDFAIAEECGVYDECDDYTAVFGDLVYEIEYTDENPVVTRGGVARTVFEWACAERGSSLSVLLRDRDLVPAGEPGYHVETC